MGEMGDRFHVTFVIFHFPDSSQAPGPMSLILTMEMTNVKWSKGNVSLSLSTLPVSHSPILHLPPSLLLSPSSPLPHSPLSQIEPLRAGFLGAVGRC